MTRVGVGLLGCGVVGTAFARGVMRSGDDLRLAGVAVRDVGKERDCPPLGHLLTDDPLAVVEDPDVDVVVEVMGGLDAAHAAVVRALELGKPVVTANKALLGTHGPELRARAVEGGVPLLFEAAVGGGIPLLRGLAGVVDGDQVVKLEGVLNGTANFVLCRMEAHGLTLAEAVAEARELGYAEADPSRDLDGTDTADKLAILAQYALGETLRTAEIPRLGIGWITPDDIAAAGRDGRCWRLVGTVMRGCARVEPQRLRRDHPLARLGGPENGVLVTAERAGPLLFAGAGAGGEPTAAAVRADVATAVDWVRGRTFSPGA